MSTPWGQPPAPQPTQRPWYKKKRFMLPIGTFVGLGIAGSFIDEPATPTDRQTLAQVVEATSPPPTADPTSVAKESTAAELAAAAEVKRKAKAEAKAKAKAEAKAKAKAKARAVAKAKARKARAAEAVAEEQRRAEEAAEEAESDSTYYENCDAVRAAGAAPIRVGDPGYSRQLDRDGDGVACE
jgi:hypothetical protein